MKPVEKIPLVAAGAVFLLVLLWAIVSDGPESPVSHTTESGPQFSFEGPGIEYTDTVLEWNPPAAQGGSEWVFDIFSPPVIYYDPSTGAFTVTPPYPDAVPADEGFEIGFRGIRPEPYRFQLVSYAGARGNYLLTLENLETGRDVFASPGETLEDDKLKVLDFAEKREVAEPGAEGTTEAFDLVGEATVLDQRSGKQFLLKHNAVTYREKPVALFTTPGGANLELQEGETWESETAVYTLIAIQPDPVTITLEKTPKDGGDILTKTFQVSRSYPSSDLSNRSSGASDPPPGAF